MPAAAAFATLAAQLDGAESVERLHLEDHPDVTVVAVERAGRPPLQVLWTDERDRPLVIRWPWSGGAADATDPAGMARRLHATAGHIALTVSGTPTLVSAPPPARAAAA
jgi:hypothetical protein